MVPEGIRIKFRKTGRLRYISHLDLDRTVRTALVRTKIPVWYTEGFNPHAKMVFAQPLPLFAESECELLDIKITEKMSFDEIKNRLRAVFTDELYVTDVYTPRDKFTDIAYAEYRISGDFTVDRDKIDAFLSGDINVVKKTKSGEKTVNIRSQIKSLSVGDGGQLHAVLDASGASYLNPDILCRALFDSDTDYLITRTGWLKEEKGELKEFI